LLLCAATVHYFGRRLPEGSEIRLGSPAGLYLCLAVVFSSVSIAARSLARLRKLESPEGLGMMSAAVADKLTGMIWLALAASAFAIWKLGGVHAPPAFIALAILRTAAVAVPVCLACWFASQRLSLTQHELTNPTATAALLLAVVMIIMGGFSHSALALLAGAYLTGLTLAGSDWRQAIQDRLEFLHAAFVPACFALLGMRLNLALFASPAVWAFAGLFLLAAIGGKLIGCWIPAQIAGFNLRGWLRIGLGLTPRGEVTLAIATIGVYTGYLGEAALAVVVLLVFVTMLTASPLMALIFGNDKPGLRTPLAVQMPQQMQFTFASRSAARAMLQRLIEVLETEGFHVQLLNRHAAIYQLSKDRTVLGLRPEDATLIIDCAEDDHPLVNSAMLEVLAGIERHLRELRRPLDAVALRRNIVKEGSHARPADKTLGGILNVNTLRPRLLADTKAAAITELIELLDDEGLISDRHDALSAVITREEGMSTGLEHGIAMPHARTNAVDRLVCAVGIKQEGIDFGTLDGGLVRIVILLLAPLDAPAPQLQAIAHFSRILNDQGRPALLACDSAEDMLDILTGTATPTGKQSLSGTPGKDGPLACLQWHSVSLDLQGGTKEEIIDQMLALCARSGVVTNLADARTAVLSRENKSGTGMEHGIALPHARTEAVSRMVCALGISRKGVDFEALDGQPSRVFIMVLMPIDVTVAYTRLTAGLMRALDEKGREALLAAKSGSEAVDVLSRGMQPAKH
jgi:mannitol/fructose-specific phosphotransferase system IIA component (Ntr-type)/Kef-type K+ transport system membrane component KefB